MRKQKERVKCPYCGSAVSTMNCDRASFGARNPTPAIVFESKETGRTLEETEEEKLEARCRAKGIMK